MTDKAEDYFMRAASIQAAVHTGSPWLPIETAPKDGTEIVLYGACCPEHSRSRYAKDANIGWFSAGEWKTRVYGETCDATHWMPLPEPPAA